MASILQKFRNWSHSSLVQQCLVDDSTAPSSGTIQKLTSLTFEGPHVSRDIAMSFLERLEKRSSSLSTKILPIITHMIRYGSICFKLEMQNRVRRIRLLRDTSLECQGTTVTHLYQELVELIESEYKESLLCSHEKSFSLHDIPAGNAIIRTRGASSTAPLKEVEPVVVVPEVRMVEKITRPSHVEPLPPMVEIWDFARQYKQLDQRIINRELVAVLEKTEPMAQLRALSVIEYLSQHNPGSVRDAFLSSIEKIAESNNNDLNKRAEKILLRLSNLAPGDQEHQQQQQQQQQTPPTPPSSGEAAPAKPPHRPERAPQYENLSYLHVKRSYDKIVHSTDINYATINESSYDPPKDDALLDLSTKTLPPPSSGGLFTIFGGRDSHHHNHQYTATGRRRSDSAGSTDRLLNTVL